MSNNFVEHQTLYLNIKLLSITRNISMLWRIVELACDVTWRLSRRNHQQYKPQMEQRSAGEHDVIECEDCRETITWCSRCVEESSLRLAVKQSQFSEFLLFSLWHFHERQRLNAISVGEKKEKLTALALLYSKAKWRLFNAATTPCDGFAAVFTFDDVIPPADRCSICGLYFWWFRRDSLGGRHHQKYKDVK